MKYGPALMRQAEVLAGFTEDAPRVTRTYLSPEHKQAGDYLIALMRNAGMQAGLDALGNIVGRYVAVDPNAPVVMTGSHQDSVRNAGKYDGLFGILSPIACVADLNARNFVRCTDGALRVIDLVAAPWPASIADQHREIGAWIERVSHDPHASALPGARDEEL